MQRESSHASRRVRRRTLVSTLLGTAIAATTLAVTPAPAAQAAAAPPVYQVTMVARWCDAYTDIFGNRARNDIMESLRDLGPNTPYNPFVSVQPAVEDGRAPQSTCHPLPGWTFSFGTGYSRPVPGTNLSYVRNPAQVNNRRVTTTAATALLDDQGNPTGVDIPGAVTFDLTANEASLASQKNKFWVMGGTPTEPLNAQEGTYGFGALRCAKDNLNGDNVEWIGFPSGATHVFCYAFYVKPPPEAGIINIRKQLANGRTLPADISFPFDGNLSFNPGGDFSVEVPANTNASASKEFVRGAGGAPWVANEIVPDGFVFVSVTCVSANDTSTWTPSGTSVSIELGAGDTITCTFLNDLAPPPVGSGLLLKQTFGDPYGVPLEALPATWAFDVVGPSVNTTVSIPVDPADGVGNSGPIANLTAGTWTVTEQIPAATAAVRWDFVGAYCVAVDSTPTVTVNSVEAPNPPSIQVVVPAGGRAACSFVNQMVPLSKLSIRLTTLGGTGTFGFDVQGNGDLNVGGSNAGVLLQQSATTTAAGTRVTATGDSTDPLYGSWFITPVAPKATAAGRWQIAATPTCNVSAAATNVGAELLDVRVGADAPDLVCDYVYRFVAPSTLDVVKVFGPERAGQQAPVIIDISCEDGTTARLTVPVGSGPKRLPAPLAFVFPTLCTIVETDDGGGGNVVERTVTVTVDGVASQQPPEELQIGTDTDAQDVVVQFRNNFADVSSGGGTVPVTLPATGGLKGAPTIGGIAMALVALGSALLLLRRRRGAQA
ncbi:MAG: prealbumin-like fold domain-containing protein [Ilumatobacteraceae bacterium]